MSSIIPAVLLPTDIVIDPALPEHASTKLKGKSILRLHKLATVHDSDLVRALGIVSTATWSEVEAKLRLLLGL